jgi:hypothetical protein
VSEQVPNGDRVLPAARECREVGIHRSVEIEPPLVEEHHRRRRGTHDLRERCEIVDRLVGADPRAAAGPTELPESFLDDGVPFSPNDDRSAGVSTRRDPARDDAVDRRQSGGRHANRLGRVDRQTIRHGQRDGRAEDVVDHSSSEANKNSKRSLRIAGHNQLEPVSQRLATGHQWRKSVMTARPSPSGPAAPFSRLRYSQRPSEVPSTPRLTRPTVIVGPSYVKTKCRARRHSAAGRSVTFVTTDFAISTCMPEAGSARRGQPPTADGVNQRTCRP